MDPKNRSVDEILGELALGSYGVVTRQEMRGAGITEEQIKTRVRRGTLLREHRGVYRLGHRAPSTEATYLAAVSACGEGARLSGFAAAHHLEIRKGTAPPAEVTSTKDRRVAGVITRRVRSLDALDTATYRSIPVTTVPRTLVDIAARLSLDDLARVAHEAGVRHGTTPAMVAAALERRPNAPGAADLRRVVEGDVHVVLSRLEKRFLALLLDARLPLPVTNRVATARRVDCRWPDHRLTVELDSYRFHSSRHAWERDRRREREAYARGDQFRRYTRDDVFEHPGAALRELEALLAV